MATRLFVPRDAAARAVGADKVAAAIADESRRSGLTVEIVRTGSRGLFWLEPLVEVETPAGRIGFGPVAVKDVAGLFANGLPDAAHSLCVGQPEEIPFLKRQTRITFARCGIVDPLSLADYRAMAAGAAWSEPAASVRPAPSKRSPSPAPRPRRRGLPDRHQVEDRRRYGGRS